MHILLLYLFILIEQTKLKWFSMIQTVSKLIQVGGVNSLLKNVSIKYIMFYPLSHVILGSLSNIYPVITYTFLIYQYAQYYKDCRFFFHLMTCDGNSMPHTIYKISQFMAGKYLLKNL